MITIKTLKELIKNLPDDAECFGYEGEDTGIVINKDKKQWFIRCSELNKEQDYTEGFESHKNSLNKDMFAVLSEKLYNEKNLDERLSPSKNFSRENHYKVTYRFLVNLLSGWRELGLKEFPTKDEAEEIAMKVDYYFAWLLKKGNEESGYVFSNNYDFIADVWKDM